MSNFYLDIIKDRLYCDPRDSLSRKSAQTAIYLILDALVRMLAPLLAFTSEEIWEIMPHHKNVERDSVLYNEIPKPCDEYALSPESESMWGKLLDLRADVNKALELARADKIIGKPLEAEVTLNLDDAAALAFEEIADLELCSLFIVSSVIIKRSGNVEVCAIPQETSEGAVEEVCSTEFPGVKISVHPSTAPKCARCWIHNKDVGLSSEHPELCPRCLAVIEGM
jgi:isoleucyl-tRNA synthetase